MQLTYRGNRYTANFFQRREVIAFTPAFTKTAATGLFLEARYELKPSQAPRYVQEPTVQLTYRGVKYAR